MKAVVYHSYGTPEVLRLTHLPRPVISHDGILVRVINTTVTAGDWRLRKADPFLARIFNGLFRPKRVTVLGFELSGIVEETGKNVSQFKIGDPVMAHCGLQFGGYAEYRVFKESDLLIRKPENLSFEAAAVAPVGGTTAIKLLAKINLPQNASVLINGASGSVGSFCVQLAKHAGYRVTAVCSFQNSQWVKALGAEKLIDYTTISLNEWGTFDAVIDAVGTLKSSEVRKLIRRGGKTATVRSQYKIKREDMQQLGSLLSVGAIKPVIDCTYPLEDIRQAHAYAESMRKKGGVVIRINSNELVKTN